ncbi:ComEA family DNA-binding protein [Wohlfahrtiimonas larvae]|uniref:Helix-hairpin-helix DNA-binding motif class 1 domain-containing protein n=1 Tax=Wohlfahrtiimonas larvae TaxID=1157986 RepID=A0ABP9MQH6_9GAMM|nr:helix-hairpin-helix domain-containing protein [Wohlfahrtiimonas larvae]
MKTIKIITTIFAVCGFLSVASALNINTADAPTLSAELKGIGITKAEAIVNFRTEHGPFSEPEDLIAVPGIGPKLVETIRDHITFDDQEKEATESTQ